MKHYDKSNWQKTTIGDLCDFSTAYSKSSCLNKNGKFFVVDMGSVSPDAQLIATKRTNCSADFLKTNDIVMPKDDIGGGQIIGKTIVIAEDNKYVLGDHVYKLSTHVNAQFLSYLINSQKINKYMRMMSTGSAQLGLSKHSVAKCEISLPGSEKEQMNIANKLRAIELHIANIEKLITKQEAIKKSTEFLLLQPKAGWHEYTLGDICDITGAGVDKKINPNEEKCILLNYLDVYHKTYVYSSDLHHVVSAPRKQKQKCSVNRNDIFFTPSSETPDDIARSCVAMEDMEDVAYSYHIVRARPKVECNSVFIKYMCSTKDFLLQAQTACVGSGKRYVISLPKFREFVIYMPDIEEQNKIAHALQQQDVQLEQLHQELDKYKHLKNGLMDYFFG